MVEVAFKPYSWPKAWWRETAIVSTSELIRLIMRNTNLSSFYTFRTVFDWPEFTLKRALQNRGTGATSQAVSSVHQGGT